jgi:signal transduction histidine kinase
LTLALSRRRLHLPGGLQWRLTGFVAVCLLVAAAVTLAVVHHETGRQLSSEIDSDIRADVEQLSQTLGQGPGTTAAGLVGIARAYVSGQPYAKVSRLLFVVVPGQPTVSNHPEALRPETPEPGETVADQAEENRLGHQILVATPGFSVHTLPDAGPIRIYVRRITVAGQSVTVGAGELLGFVERAQHSVIASFVIAGAAVLLLALVASYLVGARVSAPLRDMTTVAARIDAGDLAPRMHTSASQSQEVRVLGESFNRMLDRLGEAFAGQRAFVADASHELRTPLTVIRGQLEVLAAQADPSAEEVRHVERLVGVEISRISRLVDDLLVLARSEHTDFLRPDSVDIERFVHDLWDGLRPTAERRFVLEPLPSGSILADPDRLAQALGNLIRNAIAHTAAPRGLVRLTVTADAGVLRFAVDDDGPGIPAEERERVFERFHRTDVARTRTAGGTGLGLAIVRAIAEAHGGQVRARASAFGGARLELDIPGFTPMPAHALEQPYATPR